MRKLPTTIAQENADVSMNEILINLVQQNRVKKFWGGRGKKISSAAAVNEEIAQEEQQPGPSRQCSNLAKSPNDESSNKEGDDDTNCKICKISRIEMTAKCGDWVQCDTCDEYISPKCYDKRHVSVNVFFS